MTVTEVDKDGFARGCRPLAGRSRRSPESILQLTEDVLELLRSRSSSAVHAQKTPELLWLDDLTVTQMNTVIVIKHLCDEYPEGVTLKKLAETDRRHTGGRLGHGRPPGEEEDAQAHQIEERPQGRPHPADACNRGPL